MTDFDAEAETWDDQPYRVERAEAIATVIRETVPLGTHLAALEYGAGTGLLGRALVDDLGSVTLADSSAGMTEVAATKAAGHPSADKLRAVRLDLMTDPVPADRYDLILSMMALHHVPDVPALLGAFHTMLNAGGVVALVDLEAEDGSFHDGDFDGHHGFDRERLAGWLDGRPPLRRALPARLHGREAGRGRGPFLRPLPRHRPPALTRRRRIDRAGHDGPRSRSTARCSQVEVTTIPTFS